MTKTPFPYQIVGSETLAQNSRYGLFDEPGLGKTGQAIMACDVVQAERIIIVCPANVRSVWFNEIKQFSDRPLKLLKGMDIQDLNWWRRGKANVFIISYDMATKWNKALSGEIADAIIFDEAHALKNPMAQRTRGLLGKDCDGENGLAALAQNAWFLTGTAMPNDPLDIWPFLRYTGATPLNRGPFTARYFTSRNTGMSSRQSPRKETLPELREMINSVSLRRTLADVNIQLPDIFLTEQRIDGDASEIQALLRSYPGLSESVLDALERGSLSFLDAQHITTLRRLVGEAKAPAAAQLLIEDIQGGVDKIVAFAWHKKVLDILCDAATRAKMKWVRIDGATEEIVREGAVIAFQNDPSVKFFFANIKAAGTGYTLTAAADIVLVESSWAPADNAQAIKRVHRISQTRKVRARFLTLENSIDETVNEVVESKTAAIIKVQGR